MIVKIAVLLLVATVSLVVISSVSAHIGEEHPDLTQPEPGPGQTEEPAPKETPDENSEEVQKKTEKSKPGDESSKKAPKTSEKNGSSTMANEHGESYQLNTPAQSGYIIALILVIAVSVLFVLSIILL